MELEKTEPVPLHVFSFEQSDGTVSQLDFSAPGEMGDFAFGRKVPDEIGQSFFSHYSNVGHIFEHFITRMASQPDAEWQLKQLKNCLEIFDSSGIIEPTDEGQAKFFDHELDKIRTTVERGDEPRNYSSGDLTFESTPDFTVCTRVDNGEKVEIPHHQAWQFAAGIIWRSYTEPGYGYSANSRHATSTFKAALDAADEGLQARRQTIDI